ncbi:P-loop containing nucleoside triphosphate hydrolase protein [Chytriomyces sp. MP71]|nr:P-loop containing nucleoside triphosphate hydrolase protein [Chytriomyces sp. MP71]
MPYGALWLNEFDTAKLNVSAILHFGADSRIAASGNFPSQGFRQLLIVSQMGQASLRGLLSAKYGSATITQGVRLFPQEQSTKISIQAGGLIGRILYPFGVSFLLPIFTIMLVKEKEDRIYIMMKLNGLKTWTYYLSHYAVFYILYALSTLVFIIVGLKSRLTFFTQTEIGVLVLLFFIWGHVQIVLAFFFSTLFSKSRIALVLVFLIVLLGVIISLVAERLFSNTTAPPAFFIWPPFAFYRALTLINTASYTTTSMPYKMSKLKYGDEVFKAIQFMIAEVFIYGLISIYLSFVTPSEFGKQYAWHFPVTLPIAFLQKQKRKKLNNGIDPLSESQLALAMEIDVAETQFEDVDVKAEKAKIEKAEYPKGSPLVISHMRKVYPSRRGLGPKFAVKDVSFAAEVGQVFGLLGPNGAGKTTLISILTGIYNPSYGHGIMAGYDIHSSSADICKVMGICPQFDILWDDLTVEEHLYFYARLKGATALNEHIYVQQALANVSLTSLKDRLSKRLSGGEKRRLSIAIALIGTPKVVFLDEPTTGLDPEVRRLIWNIVQHAKEGKAIILTTHSMEEAEALCQRIGIMAKGTLRCIGNSLRLKQLYGTGFRLFFNANAVDMARACRWVESLLPTNHRKIDAYSTMTSYEFTSSDGTISSVFDQMESGKATNGILDWGISQTTLEDVFVKIISEDDANAD